MTANIRRVLVGVFSLLLPTACGVVDYQDLPAAKFDGTLHVIWVGEGSPNVGDGLFVYVPDPNDPLRLIRENPDASVSEITPPMIYTDGGSIPRPATLFRGLSPWGYGPAYVIHDWLFVARHCLTDGDPDPVYAPYVQMSFHESAEVIAEAIKALINAGRVAPNQIAPQLISGTVAGPISFERWTATGECADHQIPDEVRERARLGTPGIPVPRSGFGSLTLNDGRTIRVSPGDIVATFSF